MVHSFLKHPWCAVRVDVMSGSPINGGQSYRFRRCGRWTQRVLLCALLAALAEDETALSRASIADAAAASNPVAAADEQYTRHIWRIQDGLPEDTVQAIQQSKDGYLWIGTTGGLVRFDGRISIFTTTPQLLLWPTTAFFVSLPRAMAAFGSVPMAGAWCISRTEIFAFYPGRRLEQQLRAQFDRGRPGAHLDRYG